MIGIMGIVEGNGEGKLKKKSIMVYLPQYVTEKSISLYANNNSKILTIKL